ncbi:MAG: precorrin-6y C5,15-methyltransferase (decarboxylating) subunit CbiE [Synergistaceae bacterium]|jgi:precorrin-6Y C5,15-methyltransferase (decarboxylating)|nr:precorrin-6y C5,15-methyltransferase (decarboxylating) subunit CbiE [Synergistaceae bacterium]
MIIIVGAGPGTPAYLTPEAESAIANSRVLIGGGRILDTIRPPEGARLVELPASGMSDAVVQAVEKELSLGDVSLIVSGDPGFYSLAKKVTAHFGSERVTVIPGISSLQLMASRLRKSWAGTASVTLHGGKRPDMSGLVKKIRNSSALVVLFGAPEDVKGHIGWLASNPELASSPAAMGWDLGLPGEKIIESPSLAELDAGSYTGRLAVLWLERSEKSGEAETAPLDRMGILPDEWFERRDRVPMTKGFTRAAALSLLYPLNGANVLEIGSGSGAMTVELARAVGSSGHVSSLEISHAAAALARLNLERAGLTRRVEIVETPAPEGIPGGMFRAVFIGGHGKALEDIMSECFKRLETEGRLVLTSITPDTTARALSFMDDMGAGVGFWRVHSSFGRKIGAEWVLQGNNPVDIIWGDK